MKVSLKNIIPLLSAVLLPLFHPLSTLAMDPLSVKEGTEAFREAWGRRVVTAEETAAEGVGIRSGVVSEDKYSVNSTNHQNSSDFARSSFSRPSSISYLPSLAAIAASPTSHLSPLTTIRPVSRIVTTEVSSISSNPSSNVLRLRGGGPKKYQPTGGLKSTGDTSDDEDSDRDDADFDATSSDEEDIHDVLNTHIQDAIETEGRAYVASNLVEKSLQVKNKLDKQLADMEARSVSSVDSTWIQNTMYKNAQMKLGATLKKEQNNLQNANNSPSSDNQGLAAKEEVASLRLKQAVLALTKAQRAEKTAKAHLKTEEEAHQEIETDPSLTVLDKEESSLNMIYQRALVVYATSDHALKKLMRDLAETKLATVHALLMTHKAQTIEDDLSFLNEAETSLELAREAEEAAEAAADPIANETAARNTWCEALKRALETTSSANALIQEILNRGVRSSLPSSSFSSKWNDILKETQATAQAWGEVVEICSSTLEKKPALALKKAWKKDLEEAVNQYSLWRVRVLWWKARKTVDFFPNSTSAANCFVAPVLEASSSFCTLNFSAPSTPCTSSAEASFERSLVENAKSTNISQDIALQQAEEMDSVYDQMAEIATKGEAEAPTRLKSYWTYDLQLIETQRTAHKAELARLQEAEARRKAAAEKARIAAEKVLEQERAAKREADRLARLEAAAKAKAEAQAAKELNEAMSLADVAWDQALEISRQTDTAKTSADSAKTEDAYNEVNRLAKNASTAWGKAEETKKVVLSKDSGAKRTSLNAEVQKATNNKEHYNQLTIEALANAQEAVKKEAERVAKERADVQAAKELNEAIALADVAWNNALEISLQVDAAEISADSTKTERVYKEVNKLAKNATAAWLKAEETKKVVLSKDSGVNAASLRFEIQTAISNKEQYDQVAIQAVTNAQKAAKKETERIAKERADARAAKELNEAIGIASVAWDNAVEISCQADVAKRSADSTKTERVYKDVNRLAKNATAAWLKAEETKKVVLSKDSGVNAASLHSEIQTAISNKEHYDQLAIQAVTNAQEAVKKEAERVAKERADAQAAKELNEAIQIANAVWNNAVVISRQADAAETSADSTKTENAYNEVNRLAKNSAVAWEKAKKTKRVVLSKDSERKRSSLDAEIKKARNNKKHYDQLAIEALANAQEVAKKAAGTLLFIENAKAEIATKIKEATEKVQEATKHVTQTSEKVQSAQVNLSSVKRTVREAETKATEAHERVERLKKKVFVRSCTREESVERATREETYLAQEQQRERAVQTILEEALGAKEAAKVELSIAQAELEKYQKILKWWELSSEEKAAEVEKINKAKIESEAALTVYVHAEKAQTLIDWIKAQEAAEKARVAWGEVLKKAIDVELDNAKVQEEMWAKKEALAEKTRFKGEIEAALAACTRAERATEWTTVQEAAGQARAAWREIIKKATGVELEDAKVQIKAWAKKEKNAQLRIKIVSVTTRIQETQTRAVQATGKIKDCLNKMNDRLNESSNNYSKAIEILHQETFNAYELSADASCSSVDSFEETIKAFTKNDVEIANLYTQKAECYDAIATAYFHCAQAIATENQGEIKRWRNAANAYESSVSEVSDAIKFLTKAKGDRHLNIECAEYHQDSASEYYKAGQAIIAGHQEKKEQWESAAGANSRSAYYLLQANGSFKVANNYRSASYGCAEYTAHNYKVQAEYYQAASIEYRKAAKAYALRRKEEGDRLRSAANSKADSGDSLNRHLCGFGAFGEW